MLTLNCATTGLEPYRPTPDAPWSHDRIKHLFRRIGFGATAEQLERALTEGPTATVERLLGEANARPLRPAPEWAQWDFETLQAAGLDAFEEYVNWEQDFMFEALEHGVREKMELFWQDHFAVQYEVHSCPTYHHQFKTILTEGAFGNFRDLLKDVTRSSAMLMFLNGFENRRQDPNENYARELFELFTLGADNGYTQQDIVEASRALTGWNGWTSYCGPIQWAPWGWDTTDKTVFGRTGNYNYATLIDVLFEERGELIATFLCRKLYRYFVNPVADEPIVAGMAATLLANDFVVLPVLSELFKSAHFFERGHIGARIKSPMELHLTWIREGGFGTFGNHRDWGFWAMASMGEMLGQPPDVAGWPGDRSWIDSNRLALRWEFTDGFIWSFYNRDNNMYPELARRLTNQSSDPAIIARAFMDYFLPVASMTEDDYALATDVFKWEIPDNYYTSGQWNLYYPSAPWQCVLLLRHIFRLPEFQLC